MALMSAVESSKSKILAFCSIRYGCTDLGITTHPSWTFQRSSTCAGVRPVAFGPKTAARIRARLRREPAVAASPEPRAVARAIARVFGEVADGARR